jgi:uncharacterized membrane protein
MGLVLALLSSALWGTSDFLGGTITRRLPLAVVAVWSQLVGMGVLLVVAVATGGFSAPTGYLGWSLVGGVASGVAILSFYRALADGTMGVVAPIAALGVAVPVAAGLISGNRPGALQDAGLVVAVLGIVLASGPELRGVGSGRSTLRPLLLAGVAAVGFGLVFLGLDRGARSSTVMTLFVLRGVNLLIVLALALGSRVSLRVASGDLPTLVAVDLLGLGANATSRSPPGGVCSRWSPCWRRCTPR